MYSILDQTPGDYAADEVVQDFEKTQEAVLAVQTRDLEESSLEDLDQMVQESIRDLLTVSGHLGKLQTVAGSKSILQQSLVVESAASFRKTISSKYSAFLATESIDDYASTFTTVSAVESETNEEKGLFQRILDKIVEMFRWVWKKIRKLFGIKRDTQKLKEKKEQEIEEVREIEATGIHAETVKKEVEIDFNAFCEAFGFLDRNLTPSVIAAFLDEQARDIVILKNISDAASEMFKTVMQTIERPNTPAKLVRDTINRTSDRIKNVISSFDTLQSNHTNVESYGGTQQRLAGFNKAVYKCKSGFIYNRKLLIISGWDVYMGVHDSTREVDGFDVYYATFSNGEPLDRDTEVKIPNAAELKVLGRQLVNLDSLKAKNYYEITQIAEHSIQTLSTIQQKAKAMSRSGLMDERETAYIMNQVGLSMTSLITIVARAGRSIEDTVQTVDNFIRNINQAYKKAQKEKKAA